MYWRVFERPCFPDKFQSVVLAMSDLHMREFWASGRWGEL
ncbi:uncharacterized protein J3R85_006125 [Psidium guajava]|nr:uncharacterized protein J3R85_006125 [Psidium guajava]